MYTDFPKITRCCFCFPLRYGLQIWGYVKLLLEITLIIYILAKAWTFLVANLFNSSLAFVLLILVTDIIFSIILVIATHKKHEYLFKFYTINSIVLLVIIVGSFILDMVSVVISMCYYDYDVLRSPFFLEVIIINAVTLIGLTVLQAYIILLVRAELQKLRDNCKIQFFNHTCDPQDNEKLVISV